MGGWIAAIIGGLIAGLIAKAIVPGKEPGGFIIAALIGIVGGVLGNFILSMVNLGQGDNPIWNLIVAIIGAVILLFIYHALTGNRRAGTTV